MIRIVVVDDHPAMRSGLEMVLRSEPGIVPVGAAARANDLWPLLHSTDPDVVLLDYHLPGEDGLHIARRIKSTVLAPKVLLYSAYAGSSLAIPAVIAGADGVVAKEMPALELFDAIRRVARGERVLPQISAELIAEASARLDAADLPVLGMLLDEARPAAIAEVLRIDRATLLRRIDRIVAQLRVEVPDVGAP